MKLVADVNNLIAFKMTVDDIIDWCRQIHRIAPDLDPKALRFLVDCYATEALVWDKDKGIQNIFNGLSQVEKSCDGYELKPKRTWA